MSTYFVPRIMATELVRVVHANSNRYPPLRHSDSLYCEVDLSPAEADLALMAGIGLESAELPAAVPLY